MRLCSTSQYAIFIISEERVKLSGGIPMKFVRAEDLTIGMRLAKPIYNKNGVLLYERNTQLTFPGIKSIQNFGLIGIYILEPAEPLPPLTKEDLEFEQSQTIYMFQLRDCFSQMLKRKKISELPSFVADILKRFGTLDHRVNFNQNLRSSDDVIYKHSISTAILAAMISHSMNLSYENQKALVAASLLFNLGLSFAPKNLLSNMKSLSDDEEELLQQSLEKGMIYFELYKDTFDFMPKAFQLLEYYILPYQKHSTEAERNMEIHRMADILRVADHFDSYTAMGIDQEPVSEIMGMKHLTDHPEIYNTEVTVALARCIHIIPTGASVDLSTKDKGIVLAENPMDFMHPLVLRLSNNQIYDLSDPVIAKHIHIVDIMKTMDNRVSIDEHTLEQFVADERIMKTAARFRKILYGHE